MISKKNPRSLAFWLGLTGFLLIVLVGIFQYYTYQKAHRQLRDEVVLRGRLWVGSLAIAEVENLSRKRFNQIQPVFLEQLHHGPALYLGWLDTTGTILLEVSQPLAVPMPSVLPVGETWLENWFIIRQPVYHSGMRLGSLVAFFPLDDYRAATNRLLAEAGLFTGLFSLIALGLLGLTGLLIRRPLRGITHLLGRHRSGDHRIGLRLPGSGPLEIRQLATQFNSLADVLDNRLDQLARFQTDVDAIFRGGPMPMLVVAPSGRIEKANPAALSLINLPLSDTLLMPVDMLFRKGDFALLSQVLREHQHGSPAFLTTVHPRDGAVKVVELHLSRFPGPTGKQDAFLIIIADVTHQLTAQQILVKEQADMAARHLALEAHYRRIQQPRQGGADALTPFLDFSERQMRTTSIEEALSQLTETAGRMSNGQETTIYLRERRRRELMASMSLPDGVFRRRQPLTRAHKRLWQTFEGNKAVVLTSRDLSAEENLALGLQPHQQQAVVVSPLVYRDHRFGLLVCHITGNEQHCRQSLALVQNLCKQTALTLFRLRPGQTTGNEEHPSLDQLQKMAALGTLVGGIAHDFNNIMSVIIPNVELLQHYSAQNEEVGKRVGIIKEMSNRGADLTRQLLLFSQNRPSHRQSIDINVLLNRLADMLQRTFGKDMRIETRFAPELPSVWGDRTQLTQVLINLAMNARDAMGNAGTIFLESRRSGNTIEVEVRDQGCGISPADQKRIFDPFFTTKAEGEGTGLGLAISRNIIESHQGEISVRSKPGLGSSFFVSFPIPGLAGTVRPKSGGVPENTILVLDPDGRAPLPDNLKKMGYKVATASSEGEALSILKEKEDIQLAIVDMATASENRQHTILSMHNQKQDLKILLANG
ncbi:MAG TPA: ATP-binding protein, partial [Calditrichia bacterium]|nr:ATP-binding protein [Calditrichia bacterium]